MKPRSAQVDLLILHAREQALSSMIEDLGKHVVLIKCCLSRQWGEAIFRVAGGYDDSDL